MEKVFLERLERLPVDDKKYLVDEIFHLVCDWRDVVNEIAPYNCSKQFIFENPNTSDFESMRKISNMELIRLKDKNNHQHRFTPQRILGCTISFNEIYKNINNIIFDMISFCASTPLDKYNDSSYLSEYLTSIIVNISDVNNHMETICDLLDDCFINVGESRYYDKYNLYKDNECLQDYSNTNNINLIHVVNKKFISMMTGIHALYYVLGDCLSDLLKIAIK